MARTSANQPLMETMRMPKKKAYLTAYLPDGYVKTIGPTSDPFTHYWRIVAVLENGKTEIFWGHVKSLADARRKRIATVEAASQRGWTDHRFEIAEQIATSAPPNVGHVISAR